MYCSCGFRQPRRHSCDDALPTYKTKVVDIFRWQVFVMPQAEAPFRLCHGRSVFTWRITLTGAAPHE
jgi:hypothetical protein